VIRRIYFGRNKGKNSRLGLVKRVTFGTAVPSESLASPGLHPDPGAEGAAPETGRPDLACRSTPWRHAEHANWQVPGCGSWRSRSRRESVRHRTFAVAVADPTRARGDGRNGEMTSGCRASHRRRQGGVESGQEGERRCLTAEAVAAAFPAEFELHAVPTTATSQGLWQDGTFRVGFVFKDAFLRGKNCRLRVWLQSSSSGWSQPTGREASRLRSAQNAFWSDLGLGASFTADGASRAADRQILPCYRRPYCAGGTIPNKPNGLQSSIWPNRHASRLGYTGEVLTVCLIARGSGMAEASKMEWRGKN
jgi:hypothetical protein